MHRRFQRFATIAALVLPACATTTGSEFVSDRISVVARGSGSDVILIPGLTGHREEWWGDAVETLDDRYRLHLVQVNGFAGTSPGANVEGPVSAPVPLSRTTSAEPSASSAGPTTFCSTQNLRPARKY